VWDGIVTSMGLRRSFSNWGNEGRGGKVGWVGSLGTCGSRLRVGVGLAAGADTAVVGSGTEIMLMAETEI
jgi:hypothetical protein